MPEGQGFPPQTESREIIPDLLCRGHREASFQKRTQSCATCREAAVVSGACEHGCGLPLAGVCSTWAGLRRLQLLQNLTCVFRHREKRGAPLPALSAGVEGALLCTIRPARISTSPSQATTVAFPFDHGSAGHCFPNLELFFKAQPSSEVVVLRGRQRPWPHAGRGTLGDSECLLQQLSELLPFLPGTTKVTDQNHFLLHTNCPHQRSAPRGTETRASFGRAIRGAGLAPQRDVQILCQAGSPAQQQGKQGTGERATPLDKSLVKICLCQPKA